MVQFSSSATSPPSCILFHLHGPIPLFCHLTTFLHPLPPPCSNSPLLPPHHLPGISVHPEVPSRWFQTAQKDKNIMYADVMVLMGYTLAGPTTFCFSPNYITQLPWRPHKLLPPNHSPCLGPCKLQPPRPPFASALVTDWYQYSRCSPRMRVAPLYKRAGLPGPLLTFWLNMTPVTSRSKLETSP